MLESQYRTSLPREIHVYDLVKKNKGKACRGGLRDMRTLPALSSISSLIRRSRKRKRLPSDEGVECPRFHHGTGFLKRHPSELPRALLRPPNPDECRCRFVNFANVTALVFNLHRHCFTCHKGPAGITGCRLNMPRTKRARTTFVQIVPEEDQGDFLQERRPRGKDHISYRVLERVQEPHEVEANPKDSLNPFRDLDSRVIVIEQKRPLLQNLPELLEKADDENARREILTNLRDAMGYQLSLLHCREKRADKEKNLFRGLPQERIPMDDDNFTADESRCTRDPNCLYSAMQHLLFLCGVKVPSVEVLRSKTLDYLEKNADKVVPEPELGRKARTLENVVEQDAGISVKQYREVKQNANPRSGSCCWGEAIDVKLFAMCFDVNVAVYREDAGTDGSDTESSCCYSLDRALTCIVRNDESAMTVRLVSRRGLRGDTTPREDEAVNTMDFDDDLPLYFFPLVPTELLDAGTFFHMDPRLIDLLIEEIRPASIEQLRELYTSVSKKLVGRNGYVAEFNEVMSAALGVNTNCLFLGSREQSKSAVFYLGECTKRFTGLHNLLPTTDSLLVPGLIAATRKGHTSARILFRSPTRSTSCLRQSTTRTSTRARPKMPQTASDSRREF